MNNPTIEELITTLKAAGEAHHEYESSYLKGEHDEAWAGWYAAFVIGRLGSFTTPSHLTDLLATTPSAEDWFTAAAEHALSKL